MTSEVSVDSLKMLTWYRQKLAEAHEETAMLSARCESLGEQLRSTQGELRLLKEKAREES